MDRKRVYSGKIIDLIVDTRVIKGRETVREVVRHPGGVCILVELDNGRLVFVRQHRYPMDRVLLEIPAGKIDRAEKPLAAALRELEEETGLRAQHLEHVFSFYPTPGFCDEFLHLYYTNRFEKTSPSPEHDEDVVVEFHGLEEAIEMSLRGEIVDGKTLLALFWLHWRRLQRRRLIPQAIT